MTVEVTCHLRHFLECSRAQWSHLPCRRLTVLLVHIFFVCYIMVFPWTSHSRLRFSDEHLIGWRVGWAIAPPCIASAIRNIHIKLTDSAPAPFQEAALTALRSPPSYFEALRSVRTKQSNFVFQFAWNETEIIKCRIMSRKEIVSSSCWLRWGSRWWSSLRARSSCLQSFLRRVLYLT